MCEYPQAGCCPLLPSSWCFQDLWPGQQLWGRPPPPPLPSSIRAQRNRAEKERRDKLNQYINELAMLVPMVAGSAKKVDKTSVLRLSATFLRMHQTILSGRELMAQYPQLPYAMNWCQIVLEGMDGMLLVVTSSGRIVFISSSVESLLGHQQIELLGQSLFNLTHLEDHDLLRENLKATDGEGSQAPGPSSISSRISERRSFYLRLKQKVSRGDQPQYELVHLVGHLRVPPSSPRRNREVQSTNDIVLVAVVKPFKEKRVSELSLLEANRDEWISRHLVDGRIIYSDHRISYSSGYFSEEVKGIHAFTYMHKDDVRWVMIALRQMYLRGESYGSSCYRLQMKTGKFMYIRTRGYLEIGDANSVQSFICFNSPVSKEEGEKLIEEMKRLYTPLLTAEAEPGISALAENHIDLHASSSKEEEPEPATEDPEQLKQAIDLLISNLPEEEIRARPPASPADDEQLAKVAIVSKVLPPVSFQSSQAGVTPPCLKKSPRSPGVAAPPAVPTQSRPSVLRFNTTAADKSKRLCNDEEQQTPKRPRSGQTSVIVSEVRTQPQSVIQSCHTPPPSSSSNLSPYSPIHVGDLGEAGSQSELMFTSELFSSVSTIDQTAELHFQLQDFQNSFENQLHVPVVEEQGRLVETLWTTSEMGKLEEDMVQGQLQLQDQIERQGRQILTIEDDLASVPSTHGLVYQSRISDLKVEHRKQLKILKELQQDRQRIQRPGSSGHCKRQLSLPHQDVGV